MRTGDTGFILKGVETAELCLHKAGSIIAPLNPDAVRNVIAVLVAICCKHADTVLFPESVVNECGIVTRYVQIFPNIVQRYCILQAIHIHQIQLHLRICINAIEAAGCSVRIVVHDFVGVIHKITAIQIDIAQTVYLIFGNALCVLFVDYAIPTC